MSSCNTSIPPFQSEKGELSISDKYIQLMRDTVSEDSLYVRAKDTFKVVFEELQLTEIEKAKLISEHIASITMQLSATAMQTAVLWAKEERDGVYALAKLKADTTLAMTNSLKAEEEICLVQKQTQLVCANITATISGTYRENGKPTGYEADGCTPTDIQDEGLKYHQTKQVEGATYQIYSDSYRKSGVVRVGIDTADNMTKGLSGPIDPITGGYTNQQTINAERQRIAYEDSKRNHAANSAATMIGQLLSSEQLSATNEQDVARWRESIDFLNTSHTSTDTP